MADNVNIGNDTTDSQVAEGAGTFNLATNTVTYAQNIYEKLYPASTTKILTAYIALKYGNLEDYVTVSENAADQASDSSVCGLKAGDVVQLKDLLYGMMLKVETMLQLRLQSISAEAWKVCRYDESGGTCNGCYKIPFCQSKRTSG